MVDARIRHNNSLFLENLSANRASGIARALPTNTPAKPWREPKAASLISKLF